MLTNTNNKTALALFIGLACLPPISFAIHSSPEDAAQLRAKISYTQNLLPDANGKVDSSIVLPVSRGFDQQETCLCWSYAFFNALESLYLSKHPKAIMEISRGAMQFINLADRIDLKISGAEDHLDPKKYKDCWSEGGTPLSADYILKNYGALPYGDYHDVVSPPEYSTMYYQIFTDHTTPEQKKALANSLLPMYFGYQVPETTYFNGQWRSRVEYAKEISPEGTWHTYAIAKDNRDYMGNGLDPDARRNEQTHFVPKAAFIKKINESLTNGRPVLYSNDHHVILIYGADYNKNGNILSFYIKDSYEFPNYYYKADFKKALGEIMEMTILE